MTDIETELADADFKDPKKLRAFFEEIDDDVVNLHGMMQNGIHSETALEKAFLILIRALDDRWPGTREICANDMDDAVEDLVDRQAIMRASGDTDAAQEERREMERDALIELTVKLRHG